MDRVEVFLKKRKRSCTSELVSIEEFQSSWRSALQNLSKSDNELTPEEKIKLSMKITDGKLMKSLTFDCQPENLNCHMPNLDPISMKMSLFDINSFIKPNEEVNLLSVSLQEKDLEKRMKDSLYRHSSSKYWRENPFDIIGEDSTKFEKDSVQDVSNYEVVLEVEIFRPAKWDAEYYNFRSQPHSRRNLVAMVLENYLVLGNQYLTSLRSHINCLSDVVAVGEMSKNLEQTAPKAKEVYKSGFFYINGVFYNDFSDPKNKDYSQTVIDWAKTKTPNMGPYQTKKMEETKFIDLKIKLGYPYLYQHQGDCEHIIIFNNIRMINQDDSHSSNNYPMLVNRSYHRRTNCMICTHKLAKWITLGSKRVYEDPFYFCDHCFRTFNYTKEGHKIGEFKAYYFG